MTKIELLMKKYIGLHIYIYLYKVLFTHTTTSMCKYHLSTKTTSNKQIIMEIDSLFPEMVF